MTEPVFRYAEGVHGRLLELRAEGFQPKRILDIGANCGQSAILYHSVWPNTHVTSHRSQPRLRIHALHVRGRAPHRTRLRLRTRRHVLDARHATTLAKLLNGKEPYEFIKLDIQGAELDAIKGGRDIIRQAQYILVETQVEPPSNIGAPTRTEIETELSSLGFGLTGAVHVRGSFLPIMW